MEKFLTIVDCIFSFLTVFKNITSGNTANMNFYVIYLGLTGISNMFVEVNLTSVIVNRFKANN